ncbi:unnamed protein product [Didymodactylos carnosus]|uniref:Uncharacterized protein n=1 Tax=Didymodactylos carnosus TaxID=1234261 RepID=A0A8S2EPF8_9BILA|nr:unnamed protein product [Didymodactylos carnosus]CAF4026826.1 unnamed protein product [Didymodactylos carnosus]CAF4547652.1 unnamed protein product [Didymodactylos carnosus]
MKRREGKLSSPVQRSFHIRSNMRKWCILPPYTIHKAKKLYGIWCLNGPTGAGYNTSANGWMEDNVFYE